MLPTHLLYPLALLLMLCGCIELGPTTTTGCRSLSTIGEFGLVEFDLDYGSERSYAADAGRVWVVGSEITMTLRDVETGYALVGFQLTSSDPGIIQVEQDRFDTTRATFRVVGPGRAYLQVYSAGRLYDRVGLAALEPASILTVTAVDGHLYNTHGWIAHGLGEAGVVLATGKSGYLLLGPASSDFHRLDGYSNLRADPLDDNLLAIAFVGVVTVNGWPLQVYRVTGLLPSSTGIRLTSSDQQEDLPVRVANDPEPHRIQVDLVGPPYNDPDLSENRVAGTVGERIGPVVPRASDSLGWPILGLSYEFGHSGAPVEMEPDPGGEIAFFQPIQQGEVTLTVSHTSGTRAIHASNTYLVAE
ncbi:MAG: hypothetical protein JW797_20370 [Bradymonadales bacterium]|nr:hypothetical protein [Bradymonadales bacterium]